MLPFNKLLMESQSFDNSKQKEVSAATKHQCKQAIKLVSK